MTQNAMMSHPLHHHLHSAWTSLESRSLLLTVVSWKVELLEKCHVFKNTHPYFCALTKQAGFASDCVVAHLLAGENLNLWRSPAVSNILNKYYMITKKKCKKNPLNFMALRGFNYHKSGHAFGQNSPPSNRNGELNNLMSGWCVKFDFLWQSKETRKEQKRSYWCDIDDTRY